MRGRTFGKWFMCPDRIFGRKGCVSCVALFRRKDTPHASVGHNGPGRTRRGNSENSPRRRGSDSRTGAPHRTLGRDPTHRHRPRTGRAESGPAKVACARGNESLALSPDLRHRKEKDDISGLCRIQMARPPPRARQIASRINETREHSIARRAARRRPSPPYGKWGDAEASSRAPDTDPTRVSQTKSCV